MDRLLSHMAWANQKTIAHLQTLPEGALGAFAINSEWRAAEIIHHIVDSADSYAFRISDTPPVVSETRATKLFRTIGLSCVDIALIPCEGKWS